MGIVPAVSTIGSKAARTTYMRALVSPRPMPSTLAITIASSTLVTVYNRLAANPPVPRLYCAKYEE